MSFTQAAPRTSSWTWHTVGLQQVAVHAIWTQIHENCFLSFLYFIYSCVALDWMFMSSQNSYIWTFLWLKTALQSRGHRFDPPSQGTKIPIALEQLSPCTAATEPRTWVHAPQRRRPDKAKWINAKTMVLIQRYQSESQKNFFNSNIKI